jgi:predicted nucleotidyltransferase
MKHEKTIQNLKKRLREHLGEALDRVIIFGSVARGSATTASDIDVMIILDDKLMNVNWRIENDIIDVIYPIELEDDVVFDLKVMGKQDIQEKYRYMPFVEHIMKEGVTV